MMLLNKSNSIICNLFVVLVWLTARTLPPEFQFLVEFHSQFLLYETKLKVDN